MCEIKWFTLFKSFILITTFCVPSKACPAIVLGVSNAVVCADKDAVDAFPCKSPMNLRLGSIKETSPKNSTLLLAEALSNCIRSYITWFSFCV